MTSRPNPNLKRQYMFVTEHAPDALRMSSCAYSTHLSRLRAPLLIDQNWLFVNRVEDQVTTANPDGPATIKEKSVECMIRTVFVKTTPLFTFKLTAHTRMFSQHFPNLTH